MPKPSWLRLDFLLKARPNFFKEQVVSEFDLQTAKNELAEAEAALAQAKAQETNARNDLSYTEVKSPVDGVASMIPYRVGALVSSTISEPLVSVSDDQEVYAYFFHVGESNSRLASTIWFSAKGDVANA